MSARSIANGLLKSSRDLLINHIDGPVPLTIHGNERGPRNALLARSLIAFPRGGMTTPNSTHITNLGREVLCCILGDYADALVRAGVLENVQPIVLKKLPKVEGPDLFGLVAATEQESALAFAWRAELSSR